MKWFVVIVSMVLFSCGNEKVPEKGEMYTVEESPILTSTAVRMAGDSISSAVVPKTILHLVKVFLPRKKLSKRDIEKKVAEIDKLRNSNTGEWKRNQFSTDIQGCAVDKYFLDGHIRYMNMGCGDCSPVMTEEEYYFDKDELICMVRNVVDYHYPPCWSEKEYKENGITEEYKKKNTKTWNEVYYLLDSIEFSLKRNGDFSDTTYVSKQPRDIASIRDGAEEYLNTENN